MTATVVVIVDISWSPERDVFKEIFLILYRDYSENLNRSTVYYSPSCKPSALRYNAASTRPRPRPRRHKHVRTPTPTLQAISFFFGTSLPKKRGKGGVGERAAAAAAKINSCRSRNSRAPGANEINTAMTRNRLRACEVVVFWIVNQKYQKI
jgi:hypothetical protein